MGKVYSSAFVGFLSCCSPKKKKRGEPDLSTSSLEVLPLTAAKGWTVRRKPD